MTRATCGLAARGADARARAVSRPLARTLDLTRTPHLEHVRAIIRLARRTVRDDIAWPDANERAKLRAEFPATRVSSPRVRENSAASSERMVPRGESTSLILHAQSRDRNEDSCR